MCRNTVPGRIQRPDESWCDTEIPACVADIVRALNVQHITVAKAECGRIRLRDGRILLVKREE